MDQIALFTNDGLLFLLRWFHFLAGVTWIGILYYFNLVQTPFFGTEVGGKARGLMMQGLMPSAMWWFRWGAMFTFLTGWTIVLLAIAQGTGSGGYYGMILTGGILGTFMWANVWFVIWPAQRLGIASAQAVAGGGQADPEAAKRAPFAGRASRTNTLFSVPMLFFMGAARHLGIPSSTEPNFHLLLTLVIVIAALFELNIFRGTAATQKPLATVSGTVHTGLGLTVVLYVLAELLL